VRAEAVNKYRKKVLDHSNYESKLKKLRKELKEQQAEFEKGEDDLKVTLLLTPPPFRLAGLLSLKHFLCLGYSKCWSNHWRSIEAIG